MKNEKGKTVRKPVAAGLFYPADPGLLRSRIMEFLDQPSSLDECPIMAIIVPHAGYSYSGAVAALAYREIRNRDFKRVIVISPSHRDYFQGVSVYAGDFYQSPLGDIEVDREFCGALAEQCDIAYVSDKGHQSSAGSQFGEHALEVQLPFLQCALKDFKLVPLVMGQQDLGTSARLGLALSRLCGDDTLLVASSDLSHFHSYEKARNLDLSFLEVMQRFDYFTLSHLLESGEIEACGGGPVMAALIASENLGADECRLLAYRNSGDVEAGTRDRVVGYSSSVIMGKSGNPELTPAIDLSVDDRRFLLDLARVSVESAVKGDENPLLEKSMPKKFMEKAAVFVTLKEDGNLRGCIGSIIPHDMLYMAVASAAVSAALHDPRFLAVSEADLPDLSYDISVLSRFRAVADINMIEIGRHGLLIQSGFSRGLLLPQVASENDWDRETFLEQTCIKASLPRDAWKKPATDIFAFSASVFDSR